MRNRRKILIIAPYQFGELSDCYYWAKYSLIKGWDVTYIGYKYRSRAIKERTYPGVKVKSVNHYTNRVFLGICFYLKCIIEILLYNQRNIIICRMPMCQLLPKLFPNRNIILDVRTLSVTDNLSIREKQDNILKSIKRKFKKCSVISEGVGYKIGAPYEILPLGAESLSQCIKLFDKIRLFYIGTFDNRKLSIFIEGLALFQKKTGNLISFDIVGGGQQEETALLNKTICSTGVKNVRLHGYLTHEETQTFFDYCNVGVCFVPMTEYYQHQPPTKLYEYLLSGMAVIATKTHSNELVVNKENGILVDDTAISVCHGLSLLIKNFYRYNSAEIVSQSQKYHWAEIIKSYLIPLMK